MSRQRNTLPKPNFVSGQTSTCGLRIERVGEFSWSYVEHEGRVVTAGMPSGPDSRRALEVFLLWCSRRGLEPLIFGCEDKNRSTLEGWDLTEIGRQPLFFAGPHFDPELSGPDQPSSHRELRRQARRARKKGLHLAELTVGELWSLSQSGALDRMLFHRWQKRGLADFSFLVEFDLEKGNETRRAFVLKGRETEEILGLVMVVPSERGWLLEHQLLSPEAPNGTGELLLCELLSVHLAVGECLSLGITPLYREIVGKPQDSSIPCVLEPAPAQLQHLLLRCWEPFYGFQSLLEFRRKLEAESWEPVYWAVPKKRLIPDILSVLRAFAGGSFIRFVSETAEKRLQLACLGLKRKVLPSINLFYIITLLLWIPILWNLDGVALFGNPLACKVWAIYDILLVTLFIWHQRVFRLRRPSYLTDLLFGLVTADTALAWIQTIMYHGGVPSEQPLGTFVFVINTAPISAFFYLLAVKLATKPLPFTRRE